MLHVCLLTFGHIFYISSYTVLLWYKYYSYSIGVYDQIIMAWLYAGHLIPLGASRLNFLLDLTILMVRTH